MKGNESVMLTESGPVKVSPGVIKAMTLIAEAAATTAILDDSITGSGIVRWQLSITQNRSESIVFNMPLLFGVGIYVTLSGIGGRLYVQYE